jgi:hypothetical protein
MADRGETDILDGVNAMKSLAAASALMGAWLACAAAADLPGTAGVPVTLVNYARTPVHATAVALDAAALCARLGAPSNTALSVRRTDGAAPPHHAMAEEDGRGILRIHASLPPASRLDLLVEPARPPAAAARPAADDVALDNGVVRAVFRTNGWDLAFATAGTGDATLVRSGELDFWVDRTNRGRIQFGNPADMGLLNFRAASRPENAAVTARPDGTPAFVRTSRLDGPDVRMKVVETFELVPGQPVMLCRVRWENEGGQPLWIAYVGSGDGIKGRWGRDLMRTPLIQRKKSPLLGDLNGSETRCAWLGGLCRISMESAETGCGVGLSTLLPTPDRVGQGSMIWGCGAYGFQCNFIDPVQGQFPFEVPPHGALENGIAVLAAQAGEPVFRRTVDLWKSLRDGRTPRLPPACAVFVDGEPLHPQAVDALPDAPSLWVGRGDVRRAALRMDFGRTYECRLAGGGTPPAVTVRSLAPKAAPVALFAAVEAGMCALPLNRHFPKPDEAAFVLEATGPVAGLSIAEILPSAPLPLSPVPDASVTDFATMFRWAALPMVMDYDLQWAASEDFAHPSSVRVTSSEPYPWFLPEDAQLPAPGRRFWRVRGAKGAVTGAWSVARAFTVNADRRTRPPRRPLTPEQPLFTIEATRVLDYTAFRPDIPADLAPYVGIVAEGFEAKGIPVTDFARGMERLPHPILLRSHWVGLADIEWLFQHVPTFAGIQGGEHLSSLYNDAKNGDMRYHHRLTRLCAKYGMLYQEADGTYRDDKWQDLMDRQGAFVREFGPWLVLSQKNNIIRRQFYSQSAAMGLWLGGLTHAHGAWEDGGFYWQNAGFNGMGRCDGERRGVLETMPRIFWSLVGVMGIGRGCGIYSLDGQTPMYSAKAAARDPKGAWPPALWDETGRTSDTFHRFIVPLVRATVKHRLIPTRGEVLANVRLAVFNDRKAVADEKTWTHYAEYGPLYAGTYGFRTMGGIDGQLWEFFPNTGRYHFIPVLPQGNAPLGGGIRNVPVSELQSVDRVKALFNAAYPSWYEGDAFVARAGSTLTVLNSRENEDVAESYSIPIGDGTVARLAGRIGPHAYLVARLGAGGTLWLQANTEYPDRDTGLVLTCARRPVWRVAPETAALGAAWDDAAHTLTLRLAHADGAVEVTVE